MTTKKGIRLMQGLSGAGIESGSAVVSHETLRQLVIAGNLLHQGLIDTGNVAVIDAASFDLWGAALARLRSEVNISEN